MEAYTLQAGLKRILNRVIPPAYEEMLTGQDVTIKFLSAEDLPEMDLSGSADPFFLATIDDEAKYKSRIKAKTLIPQWTDEECIFLNVPRKAKLTVQVYDKDDKKLGQNDYIGRFEIENLENYKPPPKGHLILGSSNEHNGRFHLSIESVESSEANKKLPRYTYDGPCRFTRHSAPLVSRLILNNTERTYYTWKVTLRRVSVFFKKHERQQWNRNYPTAQNIFNSPASKANQAVFKVAHKVLYGQTISNDETGQLFDADDLWSSVFFDEKAGKMRARVYTYIIDDNTWRFGETGEQMFVNHASKHALHANCAESVCYAGEFHPQPKFGWDHYDDEWELVFDNQSGTYAPHLDQIKNLVELLQFNFPGLNIVTYDRLDPRLVESRKELVVQQSKYDRNSLSFKTLMFCPSLGKNRAKKTEPVEKEMPT